jgi:hypothetical protein
MEYELLKADDPRSPLERARRLELLAFARANSVTEIKHDMPAPLMRKILRLKGLTNIKIPDRKLGAIPAPQAVGPSIITRDAQGAVREKHEPAAAEKAPQVVNAEDELERAYREMQQAAPEQTDEPVAEAKPKRRGRPRKVA